MNKFNVTLNMHNYFDFDKVYYEKRYDLFYLSLVSKATGEIIEIPMTNEQFDMLLEEMQENERKSRFALVTSIPLSFQIGGANEQTN